MKPDPAAPRVTKKGAGRLSVKKHRAELLKRNAAATHCPEGHRLSLDARVFRNGVRVCETCRKQKAVKARWPR